MGPSARYPTGDTRNLCSPHCPEGKRETQTNEPQKTTMEGPRQKRRGQNEKAQCSSYVFGSKVCFILKPAKQSLQRSLIQTSPKSVEIFSVGLAGPNRPILWTIFREVLRLWNPRQTPSFPCVLAVLWVPKSKHRELEKLKEEYGACLSF